VISLLAISWTGTRVLRHHTIIEPFGLEGAFKAHQVQTPAMSGDIFSWRSLLRAPSNPALTGPCPSCAGAPELDAGFQVRSHQGRVEGQNPLPHPAGHPFLMQPRTRLAFWAASAHCQITSSFSSIRTPKSFSTGLLSIPSSPSPC